MKCRRVEKLIPLYVEGDLASGVAERISSHLEWCGRCNWLADEYKESQRWLCSSGAPEFDPAALNAFKAGVLSRIEAASAKPSALANLMQHWSRRQLFALSTAALIILGMVVLYVYQTRARTPVPQIVESNPSEEPKQPDETGPAGLAEKVTQANSGKRHNSPKRRLYRRTRYSGTTLARRGDARVGSEVRATVEQASLPRVNTSGFGDSRPMLRIEIQTSDPNIRIIWFAPKETESNQTKPATD